VLNRIVKNRLGAFEREWNYDTSYMREIVDEAGAGAVMPLFSLQKLGSYRRDVPSEAYHAAGIVASQAAGCGPCLQLGVAMAERAGVRPSTIRAVLAGDFEALPEDARLGAELARATVARDGSGDGVRAEILRRWGRRALVSLAYGMVVAQAYPTFKYAIGHGHACVRVRVGGEDVPARATVHA